MAFRPPIDFQRPSSQLSIDRKPINSFVDVDEFDSPEEPFMASTMISPAPTTEDRRDSFGQSAGPVFSPQSTGWGEDFTTTANMPERHFATSGNPFLPEHSNNPFLRGDASAFAQHNPQWPMFDQGPEPRTAIVPHGQYENFNGDYESTPASAFPHSSPFGPLPPNAAVRPSSVFPSAPTPAPLSASSPPSGERDWMGLAEQAHIESRTVPKRLRGQSPQRFSQNYRNDNGIRKKNARFEIPAERNLANIDQLIQDSKNDDEIKELKQQKRLLRNRQAALDSRQRKKQRAEELEDENKRLRDQISALADDLHASKVDNEQLTMEKETLLHQGAELQQRLQQSEWDKENLVVDHTKETSELRKKIQVLQEFVESKESSTSTQPDSAHYEYSMSSEMNGLTDGLDMDPWTDTFNDFVMDQSDAPQNTSRPIETSLVVLTPKKRMDEDQEEKNSSSGLFMLLLLCGAWVASKASTSMPVTLPRMPEKVASDAAVVFDDLMKDHGVSTFQADGVVGPSPSSKANIQQISFPMPGSSSMNKFSRMHSQITRPSKQQEAESAFSLTAKQYDSYTSSNFAEPVYSTPPEDDSNASTPSYRRHLVDSLKAMRDDAKGQTANVYTRSLLWDRIPDNVVQEFKRMAEQTSQTVSVDGDSGGGESQD